MKATAPAVVALAALALTGCASSPPPASTSEAQAPKMASAEIEKKRAERRKLRDDTLEKLYKDKPEVRTEIEKAEGYAVFDGTQLNLVLYVGASGQGILVDNKKNGAETFMGMKRAGTGPGVGFKDYKQILVFKNRTLFDQFKSVGADVSASADATVKTGGKGSSFDGNVSFNPELSVYQITDRGLLLQANWGGVAYYPEAELN
jgi:lipid-binding SYLF domain-containing protein